MLKHLETISISKFKATCLELLKKVQRTNLPLVITLRGEPIAVVHPPSPELKRTAWLGSARETGEITGDIISPVAEDDWEILES